MPASKSKKHTYDYPRPALTVDVAVITREQNPRALLIKRLKDPFASRWALPGGFVEENERLIDAAARELMEETGVPITDLEQLYTAGDPGRDPRGWVVSVVFLARIDPAAATAKAADDAAEANWFPLDQLPPLAFDHAMLLERVKVRLRDRAG